MNRLFALITIAAVTCLVACTPSAPLATVGSVELDRYYGTWYEIARLPNRFQAMCASDTRALYRSAGENVAVVNQCRTAEGKVEQANGIAKIVAGSRGAKLRVSFFRPFYGDYWILELDPDYRWVLVGEPGRDYAWILARETTLDEVTLQHLLARAAALGFNREAFVRTSHSASAR